MEELTSLGESVAAAKGRYDAACKRLLAERQVLARMLREWVPEFAGMPVGRIEREGFEGEPRLGEDAGGRDGPPGRARLLAGEDATLAEGTAVFDVRVTALAPGGGRVELDVEAQGDFRPGYPLLKRAAFYAGRLLSQQGDEVFPGSRYERVHKVVSVWVCSDPPRAFEGTVTSFALAPGRLVGGAPWPEGEHDLVQIVMACLSRRWPDVSPGALGMLEVLLCDGVSAAERLAILRDRYGMMVTREVEEGVGDVCNLSEGVFRRGVEQGIEQGIEQGREQGIEQGREEGREQGREEALLGTLRSLMAKLGLAADAACDLAAVPDADRPRLLAALRA